MKNADMPAMPQSFSMNENECGTAITHMVNDEQFTGLTKREMFAMNLMNGILSNSGYSYNGFEGAAKMAIDAADALLAELEKNNE